MSPSYFHNSGYSPDVVAPSINGSFIKLSTLPPFLRTLMVADGTVTKALEAFFWEKINVIPMINKYEVTASANKSLNCAAGTRVLCREVLLKGENSDTVYASARSLVITEGLPEKLVKGLEKGLIGIGELLSIQGCETYRDIMNINHFPEESQEDSFINQFQGDVISRSYRISVDKEPVIQVTEYFPISVYI